MPTCAKRRHFLNFARIRADRPGPDWGGLSLRGMPARCWPRQLAWRRWARSWRADHHRVLRFSDEHRGLPHCSCRNQSRRGFLRVRHRPAGRPALDESASCRHAGGNVPKLRFLVRKRGMVLVKLYHVRHAPRSHRGYSGSSPNWNIPGCSGSDVLYDHDRPVHDFPDLRNLCEDGLIRLVVR